MKENVCETRSPTLVDTLLLSFEPQKKLDHLIDLLTVLDVCIESDPKYALEDLNSRTKVECIENPTPSASIRYTTHENIQKTLKQIEEASNIIKNITQKIRPEPTQETTAYIKNQLTQPVNTDRLRR